MSRICLGKMCTDTKIKTIDETGLIPVLVASIKEQQAEIEKLKRDIAELKAA